VDGPGEAGSLRFRVRQDIVPERAGGGTIELGWTDRAAIDRDTEIAVEQLCGHLASALERMDRWRKGMDPVAVSLRRGA